MSTLDPYFKSLQEREALIERFSNRFGNIWQEVQMKEEQGTLKPLIGRNIFDDLIDFIMEEKDK